MTPIKVYLAGPDVFYPNARELADSAREKAAGLGIHALIPIDNDIGATSPAEMSREIFEANVKMIREADAVIANLSPFRGPSADAGTVWEVGFAHALGKPVIGYSTDLRDYKERVVEPDGMLIEDFGNIDNLMIAHALAAVVGTLEDAFQALLTHRLGGLKNG
ncbi:MAG: nucleoside 2-deoxyribosyltransferase [Luteolibacter sp.]